MTSNFPDLHASAKMAGRCKGVLRSSPFSCFLVWELSLSLIAAKLKEAECIRGKDQRNM